MEFVDGFTFDEGSEALVNEEGFFLEFGYDPFENPKEEKKFIKKTETLIRRSPEYGWWVEFVKASLGLDWDLFTGETHEDTKAVELHHHPLTLFDIVQAVLYKQVDRNGKTTSFEVAKEVLELHYKMRIGFVPILKNLHMKFHNGKLDIPMEFVFGDWSFVLKNYPVPADTVEKVKRYLSVTLDNFPDKENLWYPALHPDLRERFLKGKFEEARRIREQLLKELENKG